MEPSSISVILFFVLPFLLGDTGRVTCQMRKSFSVYTSEELQRQLNRVNPGETIVLHEGTYKGDFTSYRNGSGSALILLMPFLDAKAKLLGTGKDGVAALTLYGKFWSVKNILVSNHNGFGVLFKGDQNSANELQISDVDTGLVLQGSANTAFFCSISQARMGIHLKGDSSSVMNNNIVGASPSIYAEETSCCGIVKGNVCDGEVDISGDEYSVEKVKTKFNLVGGTHSIKSDVRVVSPR